MGAEDGGAGSLGEGLCRRGLGGRGSERVTALSASLFPVSKRTESLSSHLFPAAFLPPAVSGSPGRKRRPSFPSSWSQAPGYL